MKHIIRLFRSVTVSIIVLQVFLIPAVPVHAGLFDGAKGEACRGAALQESGAAQCDSTSAETSVNKLVVSVVNILSWIVGVAAVIAIIIGGLRFILAQGDTNGVAAGKNTVIYSVVGLIIVAMAQFIVKFVLTRL